jgi:hypothetical protein
VSAIGDIYNTLKVAMELTGKVETVSKAVDSLITDVRDMDRRLVRVETVIEITRADGAVLRLTPSPGKGGSSTED